jgi:hypothetical protein
LELLNRFGLSLGWTTVVGLGRSVFDRTTCLGDLRDRCKSVRLKNSYKITRWLKHKSALNPAGEEMKRPRRMKNLLNVAISLTRSTLIVSLTEKWLQPMNKYVLAISIICVKSNMCSVFRFLVEWHETMFYKDIMTADELKEMSNLVTEK